MWQRFFGHSRIKIFGSAVVNILFISHRVPFPPNKGEKIRAFNQIRHLAREHSLFLAFLVDDPADLDHLDGLKPHCTGMVHKVIHPQWRKLAALRTIGTGLPMSVDYFYSHALQRKIDAELASKPFDAIVCYSSTTAEYVFRSRALKNGPGPRLVMDFVDVDSDKFARYVQTHKFPLSWVYAREGRLLREYERKVARHFHASCFVSAKEVELFGSICPEAQACSIPNGVDTEFFGQCRLPQGEADPCPAGEKAPVLMFLGAMDYFPNQDAVVWFVREVWPKVRAAHPKAVFRIVGSKPGPGVTALASPENGVDVTGFVPDVRPYLREADVFVAPLRIARGVQNKVLEAMAAGLPVVSRPEAVQGLPGAEDGCLRMAETAGDFARQVLALLEDNHACATQVDKADGFLKNFCWDSILGEFTSLVAGRTTQPPADA